MKKGEIVILFLWLVVIFVSVFTDPVVRNVPFFLGTTGTGLLYLLGGYFLFKPKEKFRGSGILSIFYGLCLFSSFFLIAVQSTIPIALNERIVIVAIPQILALPLTGFLLLRKKTLPSTRRHLKFLLVRLLGIMALSFSLFMIPPVLFTEMLYGVDSELHLKALRTKHMDRARGYHDEGDLENALKNAELALEETDQIRDYGSFEHLQVLKKLGHVNFHDGNFKEADSILLKVIDYYLVNYLETYPSTPLWEQQAYFHCYHILAHLHADWDNYEQSNEYAEKASIFYTDDANQAEINTLLASNAARLGHYNPSKVLFRKALKYHKSSKYQRKYKYINTLRSFGGIKSQRRELTGADSLFNTALNFARKELDANDESIAYVLDELIKLDLLQANYLQAEKRCLESLAIKKTALGTSSTNYKASQLDLASIYQTTSRYPEFKALIAEVRSGHSPKRHGYSSFDTRLYDLLFSYHVDLMEYDMAHSYALKSFNIKREHFGEKHSRTAGSRQDLAYIAYQKNNLDKADSLYDLTLETFNRTKGKRSTPYASALNGSSLVSMARNELDLAGEQLEFCLDVFEKIKGNEHPRYATVLLNMANLERALGHYNYSNDLYKESLSLFKGTYGEKHIDVARTYYWWGKLEMERKRPKKAAKYFSLAKERYISVLGGEHSFIAQLTREIERLKNGVSPQ